MEHALLLVPMRHVLIALPYLPTAYNVKKAKCSFRMDSRLNVKVSAGKALTMIIALLNV
jgi:hypothetical protein